MLFRPSSDLRARFLRGFGAVWVVLAWIWASAVSAHEVPADVRVTAYAKPADDVLELLVRVPMGSMQEVDFPLRGPGYLVVSRADDSLRTAAKVGLIDNLTVYENGRPLPPPTVAAARISRAADRSFDSYAAARANFSAPRLEDDRNLVWHQQWLDVVLEYPITSEHASFAIDPRFQRMGMRVNTNLAVIGPDGETRRFALHGNPGMVHLDPQPRQVAANFVRAGFLELISGSRHLLFLLCLLVPFRRPTSMAVLAGAFGAGCVIAIGAADRNFMPPYLWFEPLIETLVAGTIVYMALDAILGTTIQRRWIAAFASGIVHGYALSFALGESIQFSGAYGAVAVFGFGLGVILATVLASGVAAAVLSLLFARTLSERLPLIVLCAVIAHVAGGWMTESVSRLAQYPFPVVDAAFLAGMLRAAIAALVLGAGIFIFACLLSREPAPDVDSPKKLG